MQFYYYPRCSTCRKAKKWLEDKGLSFTAIDLSERAPSAADFKKWFAEGPAESKKYFNTSGQVYRQMGLKDRLPSLSEDERAELLAANGMLVKRPLVIVDGHCVLIGFKEADYAAYFA